MKKRLLFLGLLTLLLLSVLPLLSCVGHTHTLTQYAALDPTCTSDGFAAYGNVKLKRVGADPCVRPKRL